MSRYQTIRNSALVAAVCGMASLAAHSAVLNGGHTSSADDVRLLGTQPRSAAEKTKNRDDLKLSPPLYRLKEQAKQQKSRQPGKTGAAGQSSPAPLLNVDIIVEGDVDRLRGALSKAGLTVNAVYGNSVGGTIAAEDLEALSKIAAVKRITMPEMRTKAGAVRD